MSSKISYRLDLSVGDKDVFYDVSYRPDGEAAEMEYEESDEFRYTPLKMLQFKLDSYNFDGQRFRDEYLETAHKLEDMVSGKETGLDFLYIQLTNYDDGYGPQLDIGLFDKEKGKSADLVLSLDSDGTAEFTFMDSANGFSPNIYHVRMGHGRIIISESTPFSKRIMDFHIHDPNRAYAIVTEYR